MVSSNWVVSGGLSGGCAADWVDQAEDAIDAALVTRFYFRKVVPAGALNFVGAQVSPGELATPKQNARGLLCSVLSRGRRRRALRGVAQVGDDLFTIASTTGSLATVLLKSSATATRIFSGTIEV